MAEHWLKTDVFSWMDLPRVGDHAGTEDGLDFERVGPAEGRTVDDELKTAANNALSSVECLGKAVVSPFAGILMGFVSGGKAPPAALRVG